jgi:putative ABC transport system substrate-binding protein
MAIFTSKPYFIACRIILVLLAVSIASQAVAATEPPLVVILSSKHSVSYQQTAQAFKNHLQQEMGDVRFYTHTLNDKAEDALSLMQQIKHKNPALIYTLGSLATRSSIKYIKDKPIVASFLLDDSNIRNVPNATAVLLEHSSHTQLQLLQQLMPDIATVGILYNPEQNARQITIMQQQARKLGLKLLAIKVEHRTDLPKALKNISKRADVLLGIPDKVVLTRKTAKQILLTSFRNRMPFIGLSSTWVKAGAVYALDWDYQDIGSQCGGLAQKILLGTAVTALPPEPPRKVVYAFNQKTIQRMNLAIPETLMSNATQVFN